MGKDKLRRFNENLTFERMFQPQTEDILSTDYELKGNWNKKVFRNNNPIVLELGCGRGEYTVALAQKYPDKNFIGIDIKGARLWRGAKTVHEENILNAAFLRIRIDFIVSCFELNEVDEIWITFPDPQARANRARKRLTSAMFLERYRKFLKPKGSIHLKTDSRMLHEYTKAILLKNDFKILEAISDVYQQNPDNQLLSIQTHYEKQYLAKGCPITYLKFLIEGEQTILEPEDFDFTIF